MSSSTEKHIKAGFNIWKCPLCKNNDIQGFVWVPITLEELAKFRASGGGIINARCKNNHLVSFNIKT